MDIIENWMLFNDRIEKEKPELVSALFTIHMGCFDELRKSGHLLSQNGKTIDQIAVAMDPYTRLLLAGNVGRNLLKEEECLTEKSYHISLADNFPCCIFVAMAATLENMEGTYDETVVGQKMKVSISYQTALQEDPFGENLPILPQCFSWLKLCVHRKAVSPRAVKQPITYSLNDATVLVKVTGVGKVDTMRTVFSGVLLRGNVCQGDQLHVLDKCGRELCRPGMVLLIAMKGNKVSQADTGSPIDELCLTTELKSGGYDSICLAGFNECPQDKRDSVGQVRIKIQKLDQESPQDKGDSVQQHESRKEIPTRKGFLSGLFGKRRKN